MYIYGESDYYIITFLISHLLHLRLFLITFMVSITFVVDFITFVVTITFMIVMTFMGDTACTCLNDIYG